LVLDKGFFVKRGYTVLLKHVKLYIKQRIPSATEKEAFTLP